MGVSDGGMAFQIKGDACYRPLDGLILEPAAGLLEKKYDPASGDAQSTASQLCRHIQQATMSIRREQLQALE